MMTDTEKRHAMNAFRFAIAALEREIGTTDPRFPMLAASGVAQAMYETARFTSHAFLNHGAWLGISPVGGQPYVDGSNGDRIRNFVAEAEINRDKSGRNANVRCWEAWAYLVCTSTIYGSARAEMMAIWETLPKSCTREESTVRAWIVAMAEKYCPSNPDYARDVINIFEREVIPMLRASGNL